jgi:hypothetical protein
MLYARDKVKRVIFGEKYCFADGWVVVRSNYRRHGNSLSGGVLVKKRRNGYITICEVEVTASVLRISLF